MCQRVKLENATAFLHFSKKGIVQQLIHKLKYKGYEEVGTFLGKWLGAELKTIEAYNTINHVFHHQVLIYSKNLK